MNIIIPIKQVPETSDVQMDKETGTMIRSGSKSIVNPLDLYALETGLRLKALHGGTVTVLTMGPASAVKVLKEAIAMGCDRAVHLSDRAFGGSDTWATSYALAKAIEKLGIPDLIIAGERATDGDTGQVGPAVASWLDMALITYVSSVEITEDDHLVAERLIEEGYQRVRSTLPALITVVKEIASPRLPTLSGKKRAIASTIPVWGAQDIGCDASCIGLKGSPTRVVKIETPIVTRHCTVVHATDDASISKAVDQLFTFLDARDLLPKTGASHA
ncbi:MAG: electron transfer flavoprotein subunit beta/FixA family protein [Sphaerochaeta sp.]